MHIYSKFCWLFEYLKNQIQPRLKSKKYFQFAISCDIETPRGTRIRWVSNNSYYEIKPQTDHWLSPKLFFHWQSTQTTNSISGD